MRQRFSIAGRVAALQRWVAQWLGDVDVSNPEGDLAEGDHVDLLGRRIVDFKCCGGAGVCPDVESFHSSEFAPFLDRVLVSFDAFPCQGDWESSSDFEDFVDDVALRAEACASKDGGCGKSSLDLQHEALVVGGDSDPGCILRERRERDIKELAEGLKENEESKLADAFRAEQVCKASCGCATAFSKEEVVGGNDPAKRAGVGRGPAVGAKEKRSAMDKVLGEADDVICLEGAPEEFPFPVNEQGHIVLEGGD